MPVRHLVDAWREVPILGGGEVPMVLFRIDNGANLMLVRDVRKLPAAVSDEDPRGELCIIEYLENLDENDDDGVFGDVKGDILRQLVERGYVGRSEPCEAVLASAVAHAARDMGYPDLYARELESLVNVLPPRRALSLGNRLPLLYEDPFPSHLPVCNLQDHILLQGYGIAQVDLSDRLRMEIQRYVEYSTESINLERVNPAYRTSVQSTSIISETDRMRGFLGYLRNRLSVDVDTVGLPAYWNANFVARFISFLIARECAKGTVLKHLTQAKKVSSFLVSASTTSRKEAEYAKRYAEWLDVLSVQLARSLPDTPGWGELPTYTSVRQWVDSVRRSAAREVDSILTDKRVISRDAAILIQRAVIASLVIGRDFPPIRPWLIRTLNRPILDPKGEIEPIRCKDVDCLRGHICYGNRLEFTNYDDDGQPQGLRLHVIHHKNDRRGPVSREPFHFDIKEGSDILSLMMVHFLHTRDMLFDYNATRRMALQTASSKVSTIWRSPVSILVFRTNIQHVPVSFAGFRPEHRGDIHLFDSHPVLGTDDG